MAVWITVESANIYIPCGLRLNFIYNFCGDVWYQLVMKFNAWSMKYNLKHMYTWSKNQIKKKNRETHRSESYILNVLVFINHESLATINRKSVQLRYRLILIWSVELQYWISYYSTDPRRTNKRTTNQVKTENITPNEILKTRRSNATNKLKRNIGRSFIWFCMPWKWPTHIENANRVYIINEKLRARKVESCWMPFFSALIETIFLFGRNYYNSHFLRIRIVVTVYMCVVCLKWANVIVTFPFLPSKCKRIFLFVFLDIFIVSAKTLFHVNMNIPLNERNQQSIGTATKKNGYGECVCFRFLSSFVIVRLRFRPWATDTQ